MYADIPAGMHTPAAVKGEFLCAAQVIGTVIGWSVGLAQPPRAMTYIGGGILMVAILLVTVSGHQREAAQKKQGLTQDSVVHRGDVEAG